MINESQMDLFREISGCDTPAAGIFFADFYQKITTHLRRPPSRQEIVLVAALYGPFTKMFNVERSSYKEERTAVVVAPKRKIGRPRKSELGPARDFPPLSGMEMRSG